MLTYYNNYLTNMAKTPNESWRDAQQAIVNQLFENTTIKTMVEEENLPFDFTFKKLDVWLDTVTEATLNAEKDDSDYRAMYFQDCNHKSIRGRYYRFNDNYWLVYSDPCYEDTIASQKVRRCNNWLKWVDEETGVLYEYPCVIDYSLSSTNAQISRLIQQANSHITVIVQGNENTLKISKNKRFIFNGCAYRFFAINNYMQNNYVDKNTPILFYDFYEDMTIDTDNLTDNIADDIRNNFSLTSNINAISNINGYMNQLEIAIYHNGDIVENSTLTYESSDSSVVTIDKYGVFNIVGNVGDVATITVQIKNNDFTKIQIPVSVIETEVDNYTININGITDKLCQGDSIDIQAIVYNNDTEVTENVSCTPNWYDTKYYTLYQIADNTWRLSNIKPNSNALILTFICPNRGIEIQKSIKLTAMW